MTVQGVTEFLEGLRGRGVSVVAVEGRLRVRARAGVVTPDLREAIRHHKAALLGITAFAAQRLLGGKR